MDTITILLDWIVENGFTLATNLAKSVTLEIFITLVALCVLYQFVKNNEKQQKIILGIEYKKRLQKIHVKLPSNIYESSFDLDNLSYEGKEEVLRHLRSYFDISNEIFIAFKRKQIEKRDWNEFKENIRHISSKPAFQDAWFKFSATHGYSTKFADLVRKFIEKHNKKIKVEPSSQSPSFNIENDPI